ncbi:hypothetical protein CTAYLR_001586 [Chrysophaeum taylorii]|uniref:DNA primase n=1 Tax=Chrysophaeum taylorii TaxID=2483200 RepID=A0AAD7UDQ2_9STRA|nr:hypothetical protein CTAYLR_001586 [Chrysophaeum taylorii]
MTEVENNNNNNNNKGPAFSEDLLRMYYARLFPYELFCQWLAYEPGPSPDPTKPLEKLGTRELCFTLKDDIYCRYQTFGCAAELKAMMLKKMPHKIDIGAVFNSPMRDHKSPSFRADERELVFDVDLSDYDDVRTCCQGATVCRKCWQFIVAAVKVLDAILRYDFGFDHLLWVYSGRRGVHCWVCDRVARELTNEARTALVSYCSLARSSDHAAALTWPLHPSLARAFDIVEPIFARDVVSDDGQQLLATPENWTKVLRRLPDDTAALIADHWATRDSTPAQKWAALKTQLRTTTTTTTTTANASDRSAAKKQKRAVVSDLWKYETVFAYVYPRLDDNVSKQRNHLLKAPFAAHPKTGRVCVPFDPTIVEDFDPCAVPTLGDLAAQIDAGEADTDLAKTDLRHAVDFFKRSFLAPLLGAVAKERHDQREREAAAAGLF